MKKINGMMFAGRSRRVPNTVRCASCRKELTASEAFYKVDGCNYAITNSAKPFCFDCSLKVKK